MDNRTLATLGSIAKWKAIEDGGIGEPLQQPLDLGASNCPLCKLYIDEGCEGCPVREETGQANCVGSPYQEWRSHQYYEHRPLFYSPLIRLDAQCPDCIELARKEREFLERLLPPEADIRGVHNHKIRVIE